MTLLRRIPRSVLATVIAVLALGGTAAFAAVSNGSDVDVRGPCDEAEHANDPECAGPQVPEDVSDDASDDLSDDVSDDLSDDVSDDLSDDVSDDLSDDGDISGPCDEAENANDPRCTGADPGDRPDNSGPGSFSSGPGPGPNPPQEDNSGPGHGGDDGDQDNSGPGHGGDDDSGGDDSGGGNSGPG